MKPFVCIIIVKLKNGDLVKTAYRVTGEKGAVQEVAEEQALQACGDPKAKVFTSISIAEELIKEVA